MFFPFLAATIVGAGAVKLGAMSAMVSVLPWPCRRSSSPT